MSIFCAWTHIELGAANYGLSLDADKTYPIKNLHAHQHELLFYTLNNLIKNRGDEGTFIINDLKELDVVFTGIQLRNYIDKNYPKSKIKIEYLIGDYFNVKLPPATSIHLKNPDYSFFEAIQKNQKKFLARCADHTPEGLMFVTYYKIPLLQQIKKSKIGYKVIHQNFHPYKHADGKIINHYGNVVAFSIKSAKRLKKDKDHSFSTKSIKFVNYNDRRELVGHVFP